MVALCHCAYRTTLLLSVCLPPMYPSTGSIWHSLIDTLDFRQRSRKIHPLVKESPRHINHFGYSIWRPNQRCGSLRTRCDGRHQAIPNILLSEQLNVSDCARWWSDGLARNPVHRNELKRMMAIFQIPFNAQWKANNGPTKSVIWTTRRDPMTTATRFPKKNATMLFFRVCVLWLLLLLLSLVMWDVIDLFMRYFSSLFCFRFIVWDYSVCARASDIYYC